MGVFATRSPYRPTPIGLSSVRLVRVDWEVTDGPIIHVSGADLMDGTPIYDIKPYLPYADAHPDARGGFAQPDGSSPAPRLQVEFAPSALAQLGDTHAAALSELLALDPRPRYHDDPDKIYGMPYGNWDVKFRVAGGVALVVDVEPLTISG